MNSPDLPPLRTVIAEHGLAARKGLGQHFLLDSNITEKIVRSAGDLSGLTVFEIGPGPGGLTRALLAGGAMRVIAIERDSRCMGALAQLQAHYGDRLAVIEGDALTIDLTALAPAPRAIIANLPYNIATPLLVGWLGRAPEFDHMTLMFQREVAERLVACEGSKVYGRLSVLAQWLCSVSLRFHLPARAFTPPPKVDSSVIGLIPRALPDDAPPFEAMEKVTAAAFGQRRKMLRSSLADLGDAAALLETARIDAKRRAETLSVEEFVALARAFSHARSEGSVAAP